jgi:hypothetical protein
VSSEGFKSELLGGQALRIHRGGVLPWDWATVSEKDQDRGVMFSKENYAGFRRLWSFRVRLGILVEQWSIVVLSHSKCSELKH